MKIISNSCPIRTRKCHFTHPQVSKDPFITIWQVFPTSLAPIYECASYHFLSVFLQISSMALSKTFPQLQHIIFPNSQLSTLPVCYRTKLNCIDMFASDESILTDAEFLSCGWAHFFPYISDDNRKNESVSFHFIKKHNFQNFNHFHHFFKNKCLHTFYKMFFKYFRLIFCYI